MDSRTGARAIFAFRSFIAFTLAMCASKMAALSNKALEFWKKFLFAVFIRASFSSAVFLPKAKMLIVELKTGFYLRCEKYSQNAPPYRASPSHNLALWLPSCL